MRDSVKVAIGATLGAGAVLLLTITLESAMETPEVDAKEDICRLIDFSEPIENIVSGIASETVRVDGRQIAKAQVAEAVMLECPEYENAFAYYLWMEDGQP